MSLPRQCRAMLASHPRTARKSRHRINHTMGISLAGPGVRDISGEISKSRSIKMGMGRRRKSGRRNCGGDAGSGAHPFLILAKALRVSGSEASLGAGHSSDFY